MCIAHCTRKSFQWNIFNLRWGNKNENVKFWLKSQQAIAFIPMAAESLGGWQKVALEQLRKLGSALARHTGQEEGETISHQGVSAPTEGALLPPPQQDSRPSFTCSQRNPVMTKTKCNQTRKMIHRKILQSRPDQKWFTVSIHPYNTFANIYLSLHTSLDYWWF